MSDLVLRDSESPTVAQVLAVQQGTVLAHDAKAFARWRRENEDPSMRPAGLAGADLERAVLSIAALDPFASDPRAQLVRAD